MAWERLRRFLWAPHPREQRPLCPICDAEVNGWPGMRMPGPSGPGYWAPSSDELIAHCPEHGHPPYNWPDGPEHGPSGKDTRG